MAIQQGQYLPEKLAYRIPNRIEGNSLSDYNFLLTLDNKNFYYKNGSEPTFVKIDFLNLDNMFVVNKILTNP